MKERIKNARPMMDLMAKKVFSNPEITAQFIRDILDLPVHHVKILDGTQIHNSSASLWVSTPSFLCSSAF